MMPNVPRNFPQQENSGTFAGHSTFTGAGPGLRTQEPSKDQDGNR